MTLTLAGAMFIAAFSAYTSLTKQINQIERYIFFDAALRVPPGSNRFSIEREAERVPAVSLAKVGRKIPAYLSSQIVAKRGSRNCRITL